MLLERTHQISSTAGSVSSTMPVLVGHALHHDLHALKLDYWVRSSQIFTRYKQHFRSMQVHIKVVFVAACDRHGTAIFNQGSRKCDTWSSTSYRDSDEEAISSGPKTLALSVQHLKIQLLESF